MCEPLEQAIPKINIVTRQPEVLMNKLLLVSIDFWEVPPPSPPAIPRKGRAPVHIY